MALTIIQIGHGRGLQIVAEGIETPFQFEFLREHGCDAVQGFLISKALPIDEFIEMYQRQSHLEFVPAQLG
ncbi:EAL domain-containing protein [bacterium]|nr:EAL domain-containing protein [bacterium]